MIFIVHKERKTVVGFDDALIAIHDGVSTGTQHMITQARKFNKVVYVVTIGKEVRL